ncbi:MAG: hypothetical protein NOU37_06555 [Candidatus Brocadiales bacterium]|nr:hypothetical protein [Candidatus Bathyanammoxibius amoris]
MALKNRLGGLGKLSRHVRIWLLGIPIIVAAGLIYFMVVKPKAGDIENMRRDISQVQSMVRAERQLLATFAPLSKEEQGLIKVTKRSINAFKEKLLTRNEIYARVTQKARSCNITGISIDPNYVPPPEKEGEEKKENVATYADIEADMSLVKLIFYSKLKNLGCFLTGVEEKKIILLKSLTITRKLPEPTIEIIFRVFAKE